ncbi:hypothetical protein DdX_19700 [Ditylenchus destructor]|uniref:Uncharacterized protein n=1 Tax=Ditylenchus destructor TaxID=166010 RepID=A0AAD4QX17_9BILA|nr:hypothetical protein DdX_19700 [Ditylenchus destructor]
MEEDLDPVMQAKFNEKLSNFIAQKRFICLPNEATYDSILAALIKFKNGSKLERYEWNYVQRYSMMISNGEEKLFRGNQEIVKREQSTLLSQPNRAKLVTIRLKENVPDKEISLRAAVGADSLSGGQGHKHCNCVQGCKTGKCNCRSLGRLCNSRCHNNTSCKNK